MNARRLVLILMAVLALSVSALGVASAATRSQDAPENANPNANVNAQAEALTDDDVAGHAYLGLEVTKLTDRIRRLLEVPDEVDGLVVMGTHPGSPAAESGMQRADVAMSFDGHELVEPRQLRRFLNSKAPGDVIEVVYFRGGERHAVSITLGEVPSPAPRPEWLKKVYVFLRAFPNAVDGSLRLMDEDGTVRTWVLTPGKVVEITEDKIAVENKLGETNSYEILDRTEFFARYHRIRPGVVQPGMEVAALTVDGNLRAVLVLARVDDDEDEDDEDGDDVRGRIVEEFRHYLNGLRENAEDHGRVPADVRERLEQRMAEVQKRLDERLAKLQERMDERMAKLQERMEEREERLRERSEQRGDDDDDDEGDD